MLQRVENECESKFDIQCICVYKIVINKPINAFFIQIGWYKNVIGCKNIH